MDFIQDKSDRLDESRVFFTVDYRWSVLERPDDFGKSLYKKRNDGNYFYVGFFSESWDGIEKYILDHNDYE
jgi:hypothetical protein